MPTARLLVVAESHLRLRVREAQQLLGRGTHERLVVDGEHPQLLVQRAQLRKGSHARAGHLNGVLAAPFAGLRWLSTDSLRHAHLSIFEARTGPCVEFAQATVQAEHMQPQRRLLFDILHVALGRRRLLDKQQVGI